MVKGDTISGTLYPWIIKTNQTEQTDRNVASSIERNLRVSIEITLTLDLLLKLVACSHESELLQELLNLTHRFVLGNHTQCRFSGNLAQR